MSFLKRVTARFEVIALDDDEDEIEQDEPDDEPEEDDIILHDSGPLGSKTSVSAGGKFLGEFNSEADAEKAIVHWINQNKWSPNIWYISDHGNASKYTLSKTNQKKIKM